MSVLDAWKKLPGSEKMMIGTGAVVVGWLGFLAIKNRGQTDQQVPLSNPNTDPGANTSSSDAADLAAQTSDSINQGFSQMAQIMANQNQQIAQGQSQIANLISQMQAGVGMSQTPSPVPTTSVLPAAVPGVVTPPPAAVQPPAPVSNTRPEHQAYQPVYVSSDTTHSQMIQTAVANPGSPVNAVDSTGNRTDYAIAKAGANGSLSVATGNNAYNKAVNQAGGQWLDHTFYKGSYDNSGVFHTSNKSQQATYNKIVPANKK